MRRVILAAVAAIGLCAPAYAIEVGQTIPVRIICETKAAVSQHVAMMEADKSLRGANTQLAKDVEAAICAVLPVPVAFSVEEKGPETRFVDEDGDALVVTPVRSNRFWALAVRIEKGA